MEAEIQLLKSQYKLQLHPTGNSYLELWRSPRQATLHHDGRDIPVKSAASSIYFLLEAPSFISWHLLQVGDEMILWHAGGRLRIHLINSKGEHSECLVGNGLEHPDCHYQFLIPNNTWYSIEPVTSDQYTFFSALVMPGWELEHWSEGVREDLTEKFPQHQELIRKLTYDNVDKTT